MVAVSHADNLNTSSPWARKMLLCVCRIRLRKRPAECTHHICINKQMKKILFVALLVCIQAQVMTAQTSAELLSRAKASIQTGKAEAAVGDLTEAIKVEPSNAEIFATRAHAYIKLGNYQASLADSNRATDLSPNFGW